MKINRSNIPIPKQWDEYISNKKNKRNLALYLCKTCTEMGRVQLEDNQSLFLAYSAHVAHVRRNDVREAVELGCDHEEANTRLLLNAKHAAKDHGRIIIQSPDTDALVLCVAFQNKINRELWIKTSCASSLSVILLEKLDLQAARHEGETSKLPRAYHLTHHYHLAHTH